MQLDHYPPTLLGELPPDVQGTRATLVLMGRLVRQYKSDPQIRQTALDMTRGLPQKAYALEMQSLFEFVRDHIRYVRDTRNVETIQTPNHTLDVQAGDCDDKSTLLAALLEAIGHPTRFVAIGMSPGKYSHVFVQSLVGTRWVSLDPTQNAPVGWQPPSVQAVMVHTN